MFHGSPYRYDMDHKEYLEVIIYLITVSNIFLKFGELGPGGIVDVLWLRSLRIWWFTHKF